MTYDPIDTSATDNAADGSVTTDTLDTTTLNNSGTSTTQDLVVNGTTTGISGGVPADFTYNDVESQRSLNTVFTNNTGSALYVACTIFLSVSGNGYLFQAFVDGNKLLQNRYRDENNVVLQATTSAFSFFVPNGSTYEMRATDSAIETWFEAEM